MVAGMRSSLCAAGLELRREIEKGALIISSDQSHLVNGKFDVDKYVGMLVDMLHQALADGYKGLWATGDMTWEFGSESNLDKLLEYERRLDAFLRDNPAMGGICQYHRDTLPLHAIQTGLCTHGEVYINETLSRLNPYYGSTTTHDLAITL